MPKKPVMLWSVPRSASTAFERIFMERGDACVFHEPYSESYYFSDERKSDYYSSVIGKDSQRYSNVTRKILSPGSKAFVFIKDMAFHVNGYWTPDLLENLNNTFIIRDPLEALNSQYKIHPEFTLTESGYPDLKDIFFAVADRLGQTPTLIDASDFTRHPEVIVHEYCRRVGIPFIPSSLKWEKKKPSEWKVWEKWHVDAANSTGVTPLKTGSSQPLSSHVEKMVDQVMPLYEELKKYKITVDQ